MEANLYISIDTTSLTQFIPINIKYIKNLGKLTKLKIGLILRIPKQQRNKSESDIILKLLGEFLGKNWPMA